MEVVGTLKVRKRFGVGMKSNERFGKELKNKKLICNPKSLCNVFLLVDFGRKVTYFERRWFQSNF